ncbi:WecB/TagA/CpsF family glycosyltransferase [Peribacillus frigoritolerans]|uniref:WecB/TagA/CpsF family glycosyltransferase n=1 Tax=Peribacillus frigoritolerans TaxID=450367 RepID=UPI0020BFD6B2|nr:WecB/TagA/CpsF family glycosyltransferase [Peribacillus frigoritolerans]
MERKINIFGVNFDNLEMIGAVEAINDLIKRNKNNSSKGFVVTPNVDHLVNIDKNKEFERVYEKASLRFVDGMPIVLLSRLFGKVFKAKISGADLTPELFELAHKKKYRIFIFGSKPGVADKVANIYKNKFGENYQIATLSPPIGFENDKDELKKNIEKINEFSPDILFVSLGSPKGETFIYNNLDSLNVPVSIQVGAAIDFMAGTVKRAPVWMQNFSLEWFYRFIKEPRRMFKRYFVNDLYFIKLVIKEIIKK